jgi:transposase
MLSLPASVQICIAKAPIDMRKSFDALENLVRVGMKLSPMSGHLFVFTNKRRDKVKILAWDRHGWSILYKRLEVGTYKVPQLDQVADGGRVQVEAAELALMLEGIDLAGAKRRKRWVPPPTSGDHMTLRKLPASPDAPVHAH